MARPVSPDGQRNCVLDVLAKISSHRRRGWSGGSGSRFRVPPFGVLAVLASCWFTVAPASGDVARELHVEPAPDLSGWLGETITDVRVEVLGSRFRQDAAVKSVRAGDRLSPELVRRGLRELLATGAYAEAAAALERAPSGGVVVVYRVLPRRLVAGVRVQGGILDAAEQERALGLRPGAEVTDRSLSDAQTRLERAYERAGYPEAEVRIDTLDTDDPMATLVRVVVVPGAPRQIGAVRFQVAPSPHLSELSGVLDRWQATRGQVLDYGRVDEAQEQIERDLVAAGFYEARVAWHVEGESTVVVEVASGPLYDIRIHGTESFSESELLDELDLEETRAPQIENLESSVRDFYVQHGFLDVRVHFERLESRNGLRASLRGRVVEGARFAIEERHFPCLSGSKSPEQLNEEIDGVLAEQFPSVNLLNPPSNPALDAAVGSPSPTRDKRPLAPAPYESYSEEAWQEVREHLADLYRSDGYLNAQVGPITLVRSRCGEPSQPGVCRTEGPPPLPVVDCSRPPQNVVEVRQTCVPNPVEGIRCSPTGSIVIPVHAGRQAVLYDVSLTGNQVLTERQLLDAAEFDLGAPFRAEEIDAGLDRIRRLYEEEAFAFALVESDLELSSDGTRARLIVSVTERERVRIRRIDVRGANRTREDLIRSRLALVEGGLYRRSLVRRSERQLESLQVFASVAVSLQDPGVPARDKVVVVNLTERLPQYLDVKAGLATGDGFRLGFEYGNRNIAGQAVAVALRSQLGLRPLPLIPEDDVRDRYSVLDLGDLLERRNTVTISFPSTGLGPRYRLEVEGLDLRDNNRDFGQERQSGALRLQYRPGQRWWIQGGATVENNCAQIIGVTTCDGGIANETEAERRRNALAEYVRNNPGNIIRVPAGQSLAITQNAQITWDRRDKALAATTGTYASLGVEHVTAIPIGDDSTNRCVADPEPFAPVCSELLRFTGRVAGYLRLNQEGLALAISLRGGLIQHLTRESNTYPDRLFFVGGIDTIRGYPQDSLVPQDVAENVLADDELAIENILLRGGDLFVNPRIELRIPILGSFQTALFLDSGNLWADRGAIQDIADLLELRYTAGTGVRLGTPIGPLVFDYGFNIERVIDGFDQDQEGERSWEDIGAFHFSIGLF